MRDLLDACQHLGPCHLGVEGLPVVPRLQVAADQDVGPGESDLVDGALKVAVKVEAAADAGVIEEGVGCGGAAERVTVGYDPGSINVGSVLAQ